VIRGLIITLVLLAFAFFVAVMIDRNITDSTRQQYRNPIDQQRRDR